MPLKLAVLVEMNVSTVSKMSHSSSLPMKTTVVVSLAVLGLSSCGMPSPQKPTAAPPAPVEVASVETRNMPVEMKAIGAVEPIASVQLKSKVQGEILEVHFSDGAPVSYTHLTLPTKRIV